MDSKDKQQAKREVQRAQATRDELVELIARAVREDAMVEPLKGLRLYRSSSPKEPLHTVSIFFRQGAEFC